MTFRQFALTCLCSSLAICPATAEETGLDLFEQRIMPIFRSSEPSSCIQCHLASVDLKDYIRPSHEETFLSLRDQGLIDTANPSESKILKLIKMGDGDNDLQAKRIHEKNRQAELDAFAAWIAACCKDETLVDRPPLDPKAVAKPESDVQVIRYARKDRVLDSFVRNVWSQRMRCFPCHTPEEFDPENPAHEKAKERYKDFVKKWGGRMNLFKATPEETMNAMIRSSRRQSSKHLPMLNFDDPTQSLLVLKPTSKLPKPISKGVFEKPSSVAPVSHMGGLKIHVDDVSYKAVVGWIADLARVQQGKYQSVDQLPEDDWVPTRQVLRFKETPQSWPAMARVQVFVHAIGEGQPTCDQHPIAFTQGLVTPRHFVNGNLVVLRQGVSDDPAADHASSYASDTSGGEPEGESQDAASGDLKPGAVPALKASELDPDAVRLPAGRYVIKVYLDTDGLIEKNPMAFLGNEAFQGQMKVDAKWEEGFKNALVLSAQELAP